ncbi:MAG: MarR family transcriptional regulator [Deltaproteobacteria bacterium]|nr:MarR family transcriptional regulator [Deltaproteobacteria bacterium]MBN2673899.1 MarR family transcriptional regulator [Deltaproteobacteria bacterium]
MAKKKLQTEFGQTLLEFFERFSAWEQGVVAESELSPAQMHALEMLGHMRTPTMKELAQRLGVTTGTLTAMIDRLEKNALVERKANPRDRRSFILTLTTAGQKQFAQHHLYHIQLTAELCAGFSEKEIRTFTEYLKKVIERI